MQIISNRDLIDTQKWREFVNKHPNGNIFQTPEMYSVYQKTPKYFPIILVCQEMDGVILGVLLAVVQKEFLR
jgi:lipid II:glycine glycyltransferase (peptidoglycan interpeptide bridge formation enzyme)